MKNKELKITNIPIEQIEFMKENPNVQNDKTFDALVESIKEDGMLDPIDVATREDGKYNLIGGEHRYKACELLGYETIPSIVHKDFNEDKQKMMLVKLNILRGKISSDKFVKLFNELSPKYGDEAVKQMMGFADEEAFKKLYKNVASNLPDEMKEEVKKKSDDVKNVDDLANILNQMFRDHGTTLDSSYMVFDYGGKSHMWVRIDNEMYKKLTNIAEECRERGSSMLEWLKQVV